MTGVFDPGLQPERTALAWRRTGLAMLTASLVAARILPETLGAWAIIPGIVGVVAAALLVFGIHRRYRRHHLALTTQGDRSPLAGGRLIGAMALFMFSAGVISVIAVVVIAAVRSH